MSYFSRAQSTPVKIARPTSDDGGSPTKPTASSGSGSNGQTRKDSVQRRCRNIVIYGHCKYQDKGCIYHHPSTATEEPAPPPSSGGTLPDSPVISGALSAQAVNAPVFVPKATSTFTSGFASSTSAPPSDSAHDVQADQGYQEYLGSQGGYEHYNYQGRDLQVEDITQQMDELTTQYYDNHYSAEYNDAAAAYYASTAPPVFNRQPLNYHLYTPATHPDFQVSTANGHFVPPSAELRQILQERSEVIRSIAPPGLNLPEELQGYHSFVPLEPTGPGVKRRKFGNWYSTVYKAIKASDGLPYVLQRIENYRLIHPTAFAPIEFWSNLKHPGIVTLKEAFTTRSFDDSSLVVVYAYHPNAKTLHETYLKNNPPPATPTSAPAARFGRFQSSTGTTHYSPQPSPAISAQVSGIPERTLWSYIVQIAAAMKRIHEAGHALRGLDASKVLITSQNRVRISSCGTMDVLMHDMPQDVHLMQQDDLTQFGRLIFALCCGNANASSGPHFQKSVDHLSRVYGQELKSLALWLISKQTIKSIDQVLDSIRHRVLQEQEEALLAVDRVEAELQGELENARLVRLMTKLGFINERPEFAREPRWSETGDRYILKLFRDYVFHQVDEHGNPVLNMSHVLTCLNKLDAGTDEKLMLVARDEQSCLVVSYKEIKNCIDGAFGDLAKATIASPASYKHR